MVDSLLFRRLPWSSSRTIRSVSGTQTRERLDEIGSDVLDFWAQLFNVDICLRGKARGHELLEQIVDIIGRFKALEIGHFVIQVENLLLEMSLLASHVETKRIFGIGLNTLHGDHSTMAKKTKGKSDAERQEPERQVSSLRGKALSSEQAGSGTKRTSRQQTMAAKKANEQEKRAGKSIAIATVEESGDESADEQAPTKKAKVSKGKEVADDRDRAKTPSEEELYHHLLNGVTWTPTRFADLDLLKEVGLDSDIEAMLEHLKMPKLLTMAYPAYRDVSCQFLSSLEVTYHDAPNVRQGWGKIKFKVNGREYNMNFKDIGRVMGFQDLADYSLPKCENLPTQLWKLITGNKHSTGADKNSHIRHPSVRYLHRMLVHAFYPRKQVGNVTEEDMRLLCQAIRPYAPPGTLPLPSNDIYASFGMVSFFVNRLEHYRDWAWYTTDLQPKVGIGGMITPLLQFLNVPLGKDAAEPKFIDGTYLRIAIYFSGMYGKDYVYHYYLQGKPVEVVLPNQRLTSLERPGAISFNLS
ncbi:hypothetical protein Bca101_007309 [Brassica carinata]